MVAQAPPYPLSVRVEQCFDLLTAVTLKVGCNGFHYRSERVAACALRQHQYMNGARPSLPPRSNGLRRGAGALTFAVATAAGSACAHGIVDGDARFVASVEGPAPAPFAYLGAKHMVTGVDHVLFLLAMIFYLRGVRQVAVQATLFSLGHSLTLIAGVVFAWRTDSHLVDAAIGLSVAYKALDNLEAWRLWLGRRPDPHAAVFSFGLIHGLGLASKVCALNPSPNGLTVNLLAFNLGVELGQVTALLALWALVETVRGAGLLGRVSQPANFMLLVAGLILAGRQIAAVCLGVA